MGSHSTWRHHDTANHQTNPRKLCATGQTPSVLTISGQIPWKQEIKVNIIRLVLSCVYRTFLETNSCRDLNKTKPGPFVQPWLLQWGRVDAVSCQNKLAGKLWHNLGLLWADFNPFTPKSDQCHISPAASPEIWPSHSKKNFSSLTQMKYDYTTNSHYFTYTLISIRMGECTFWA